MPLPAQALEFLITSPLSAGLVIATYLGYEIRYGRLNDYAQTLEALVAVVIALSGQVDGVDQESVANVFNGGDSAEFVQEQCHDER